MLKWIKGRENRYDILNSQVLLIKNHVRTFFNVKSYDIQQPIRYFKLFANWYINILLTDFWEKVSCVQQLQNEHVSSGILAKMQKEVSFEHGQITTTICFAVRKCIFVVGLPF